MISDSLWNKTRVALEVPLKHCGYYIYRLF
jgi:hypothetical protein